MIFASLSQAFFVVGLPLVAVMAVVTSIFLCHQYHTIVMSTANGGNRVNWTGDSFIDMIWKVPYVYWLLACTVGPAMIIAGILAKQIGIAGFLFPLILFWLLMPIVQLSSLYASTIWMPFTPVTLVKMFGKSGSTYIFYGLSLAPMIVFGIGAYLCFIPNPLRVGGMFLGAFLLAGSIFAYARMIGRLAFACSFVGAATMDLDRELPHYSASNNADRPKAKKKKPKRFKQPTAMKPLDTPDADDGVGYNVTFDDTHHSEPEIEKEWQPPKYAWDDDDDTTPYQAHKPEVDIKKVVSPETFAVKESELKLLRKSDEICEPKETWTGEVITDFIGEKETWSQIGIAVVILAIDGTIAMIMWSFL